MISHAQLYGSVTFSISILIFGCSDHRQYASGQHTPVKEDTSNGTQLVLQDTELDIESPQSSGILGPRIELEEAVKRGDKQAVLALLQDGVDPNVRGALNRTALHYAAAVGDIELARALVAAGANINAVDADDVTPLYRAAQSGHREVTAFLLESGADPDIVSKNGNSARDVIISEMSEEFLDQYIAEEENE